MFINRNEKETKMKKVEKLIEKLPLLLNYKYDKELKEHVEVFVKPKAFIRDGFMFISGEEGDGAMEYYDMGYPWINPELEKFAKDNNGYFEWENAGCIVFCPFGEDMSDAWVDEVTYEIKKRGKK
jgi:hypothetical protein